jgi:hypothetical protein
MIINVGRAALLNAADKLSVSIILPPDPAESNDTDTYCKNIVIVIMERPLAIFIIPIFSCSPAK